MDFVISFEVTYGGPGRAHMSTFFHVHGRPHNAPVNTPRGELLGTCYSQTEYLAFCQKIRETRPEYKDAQVYS